ncbi:MAG: hypothetical protein R3C44_03540 [Chloroflexota bacterium]
MSEHTGYNDSSSCPQRSIVPVWMLPDPASCHLSLHALAFADRVDVDLEEDGQ